MDCGTMLRSLPLLNLLLILRISVYSAVSSDSDSGSESSNSSGSGDDNTGATNHGGARPRTNSRTTTRTRQQLNNNGNMTQQSGSIIDWDNLSREALVLHCNSRNISSTGPRAALVKRLQDHVQQQHTSPSSHLQPNESSAVVQQPDVIIDNEVLDGQGDSSITRAARKSKRSRRTRCRRSTTSRRNMQRDIDRILRRHLESVTRENNIPHAARNSLFADPIRTEPPQPVSSLPAIPQSVLDKIRKDEFVPFDSLLPQPACHSSASPSAGYFYVTIRATAKRVSGRSEQAK